MDNMGKILLPPPVFAKKQPQRIVQAMPHFLTPDGMTLLPREQQPPPMYGPRGATVPPKFLQRRPQYTCRNSETRPAYERQYCEACEMELQSGDDLRMHRAQHEQCPVDGCRFRGHPAVMDKHVTALHSSGLFDKVKKLSTPEEIAAWRDERRKKYPTLANVQLRQRAQEQRQKRGERIEANQNRFGKREDRKRTQQHDTPRAAGDGGVQSKGRRNERRPNKRGKFNERRETKVNEVKATRESKEKSVEIVADEDGERSGIRMFRGTSSLKDYRHVPTKIKQNALTSLLGAYGSETDESEEENEKTENEDVKTLNVDNNKEQIEEQPKVEIKQVINEPSEDVGTKDLECATEKIVINACENVETAPNMPSDDEAPEEAPIEHSSNLPEIVLPNQTPENSRKSKPLRQLKRKSGLDYRKARLRKQNTMLEKLLETDIRHERNVLLQCVRFVCENNFFGIGAAQKPTQS